MPPTTPFHTPPPTPTIFTLQFPTPGILLVTITREHRMNSITMHGHHEGAAIWTWFDDEPSMRVAVITGAGDKMFCGGGDILEHTDDHNGEKKAQALVDVAAAGGIAGLTQRRLKKPVIAAVNGMALGGGVEVCLNCDIVIASPTAEFALSEIRHGLFAGAGGLARIVRNCGMQIGSELALTGRRLTASEAQRYGLVNRISASHGTLLQEALALAREIMAAASPDAVIVTKAGLREAWESGSVEQAARVTAERYGRALMQGENLRIGLEAFARGERRPRWVDSKL
ncbi:ClpP/crotonase [Aspergillus egyptiacus]|nr:ClpP/crotonase [Aspergillus egyptiacus]